MAERCKCEALVVPFLRASPSLCIESDCHISDIHKFYFGLFGFPVFHRFRLLFHNINISLQAMSRRVTLIDGNG